MLMANTAVQSLYWLKAELDNPRSGCNDALNPCRRENDCRPELASPVKCWVGLALHRATDWPPREMKK